MKISSLMVNGSEYEIQDLELTGRVDELESKQPAVYTAGNAYVKGQLVSHNNVIYMVNTNSTDTEPSSDNADYVTMTMSLSQELGLNDNVAMSQNVLTQIINGLYIPFSKCKYKDRFIRNTFETDMLLTIQALEHHSRFNTEIVNVFVNTNITIVGNFGSISNRYYIVSNNGIVLQYGDLVDGENNIVSNHEGYLFVTLFKVGTIKLSNGNGENYIVSNINDINNINNINNFGINALYPGYFYTANINVGDVYMPLLYKNSRFMCGIFDVPANTKIQLYKNSYIASDVSFLVVSKNGYIVIRNDNPLPNDVFTGVAFNENVLVFVTFMTQGGIAFTEGNINDVKLLDAPVYRYLATHKTTKLIGYQNVYDFNVGDVFIPSLKIINPESTYNWYSFILPIYSGETVVVKNRYFPHGAYKDFVVNAYNFKVIDVIESDNYVYTATAPSLIIGSYYSTGHDDCITSLTFDVYERITEGIEKYKLGIYPILPFDGKYTFESSIFAKPKHFLTSMKDLPIGAIAPEPTYYQSDSFNVAMIEMNAGDYILITNVIMGSGYPYVYFIEYGTNIILERWDCYVNNRIEYTATVRGILIMGTLFSTNSLKGITNINNIENRFLVTNLSYDLGLYWKPNQNYALPFTQTLKGDYWSKVLNGNVVKLGFLGDSTTDGVGTTGFDRPVNGHEGSDWDNTYNSGPGVIGSSDYINTNAYSHKLEQLLKYESTNDNVRVYNMGWSGKTMKWAYENRSAIFGGAYADVDIVGLVYGINDSSNTASTIQANVQNYRLYTEKMINYIQSINKDVFIVNPQATIKYDLGPFMNGSNIIDILSDINKEISQKYNLELIDMTTFDEMVLKYSNYTYNQLAKDQLHFKDIGHSFEAGFLFSNIVKRTVCLSKDCIVSFVDQTLTKDTGPVWTSSNINTDPVFKVEMVYTDTTKDVVMGNAWILNDTCQPMAIHAYGTSISGTYCIVKYVDGEPSNVNINNDGYLLLTLGVGELVNLAVMSNNKSCRFAGFKATKTI